MQTPCGYDIKYSLCLEDLTAGTTEEGPVLDKERFMVNRKRRQRAKYTIHQLHELELEFERNPYPNAWDREEIAQKLGIHETRIQVRAKADFIRHTGFFFSFLVTNLSD